MIEWLYSVDAALFHFVNGTLATSMGDVVWPLITDYDKQWQVRVMLIGIAASLVIWGGKRGRIAILLLVPLLVLSDQLSSTLIKSLVGRIRPCHVFSGDDIHLLVGCGGLSFPSSHAVNNFGVATVLSYFYPRAKVGLFAFASLIAISRVFVGVHYPSDILGGAVIGTLVGLFVVWAWNAITDRFFPKLSLERRPA